MYLPNLITWPSLNLWNSRCQALDLDIRISPAVRALSNKANKLLINKNVAVTQKSKLATSVSGDPHYYTSLSSYYWPNQDDPSAPWIYRDGVYNWDGINQHDHPNWEIMCNRVSTFTLAWWCTNKDEYIKAAIDQTRVWFLNSDSCMYPNLDYAQTIPNFIKGSNAGIIDLNQVDKLINCFGLIEKSPYWTPKDSSDLKKWCGEMAYWLMNSPLGKKESTINNNHGIYYDKILASFSAYAGDRKIVLDILRNFTEKRIAVQIAEDGEMPHEMSRADAHHYLIWSINGLISMAMFGENYGVDLWNSNSSSNGSIKKAIDWSIDFIDGTKEWPYVAKFDPSDQRFLEIFWRTSLVYGNRHRDAFEKNILSQQDQGNIQFNLLNIIYPRINSQDSHSMDKMKYRSFAE